jgi:hypothetical protein
VQSPVVNDEVESGSKRDDEMRAEDDERPGGHTFLFFESRVGGRVRCDPGSIIRVITSRSSSVLAGRRALPLPTLPRWRSW